MKYALIALFLFVLPCRAQNPTILDRLNALEAQAAKIDALQGKVNALQQGVDALRDDVAVLSKKVDALKLPKVVPPPTTAPTSVEYAQPVTYYYYPQPYQGYYGDAFYGGGNCAGGSCGVSGGRGLFGRRFR